MYECFVFMYVCVLGALRGQKNAVDPLELELPTFVSYHMVVGN